MNNGKLTISRPQYGNDKKEIEITLQDDDAHVVAFKIEMSYEDFTKAITGQAYIDCKFESQHLDKVGLKQIIKDFVFELPSELNFSNRKQLAKEIVIKELPEGWVPSLYFGSQNSFFTKDGKEYARTNIMKWVEK